MIFTGINNFEGGGVVQICHNPFRAVSNLQIAVHCCRHYDATKLSARV